MIVSVTEYEKLFVRDNRNLEQKQISKADAIYLQSLIINDTPVFSWGNHCLIAQHWIGVIDLPDFSIEILPKISTVQNYTEIRSILTRMLLVAHQTPSTKKIPGSVSEQKNALIEILIDIFLCSLERYIKSGLLSSYQKINKNLQVIKGRILFNEQYNKNLLNPTRFTCSYSKYITDNPLNQFFKTCLQQMEKVCHDSDNIRRIKSDIVIINDINSLSVPQALENNMVFNSTNVIAEEPYQYGKMFLQNSYITINAGSTAVNVMLFDMNKLFELFIFKVARQAFGRNVSYQKTGDYLVTQKRTGKKYINMRPDIIINQNDGDRIIIDTKWKLLKGFAKESDIYQMNAYTSGIKNITKVFLLYPEIAGCQRYVDDYLLTSNDGQRKLLCIRAIDLCQCLVWNDFISYFKSLFS